MRVSMILSALAATALASPTGRASRAKRASDNTLGGVISPGVAQVTSVLASAFGSFTGINSAMGQINDARINTPLNAPGDLLSDTSLLLHNAEAEISNLVGDLTDVMAGPAVMTDDAKIQAGVLGSSVQIVTGQVQQLLGDLTGVANFFPDSSVIDSVQNAAGSLLTTLNKLQQPH
ncbi:hypothetical protein DV738_g2125, partial [Chaetothyriales sp. CBS 135597]